MNPIRNAVTLSVVGTLAALLGAGLPACGSSSLDFFGDAGTEGGLPGWENDGGPDPNWPDGGPQVPCGATTCSGGQACSNGACICPPYRTFCNGACIPTSADPNNCGSCGNKCTGGLACSSGECSNTCLPPLVKCGNTCSDTTVDNDNCGGCGAKCAPGKACSNNTCVDVIQRPTPAKCSLGGGPIVNPPNQGGCLGNLAQTVFRWALCSCEKVQFSKLYVTDGFDSSQGPYKPGGMGAGIGSNGTHGASETGDVFGTLWIAGGDIAPSKRHEVKGDVRSGGVLKNGGGGFIVGGDAYVKGAVEGNPTIRGTLHSNATVKPPCDFCTEDKQIPVAAIIAAHSGTKNDNALINLDPNVLASSPGRLDLPCGEYYLSKIEPSGHVTIVAHGRTAVYIDGAVSPGSLTLMPAPGGELDVFVKEKIQLSGELRIGSPNYPAATRVYVGGDSGVSMSDKAYIAGNVYAAAGDVQLSSKAEQYGAIYAKTFGASEELRLHYDRAVINAGSTCKPPGGGGGNNDAGNPPPQCGSCNDCGNQACTNGACGACGSSNDCCAPLICLNGRCLSDIR